jgi:hypothetical protein
VVATGTKGYTAITGPPHASNDTTTDTYL